MEDKASILLDREHRFFVIFTFIIFLSIAGCSSPQPTGEDYSEIDTSGAPIQTPYTITQPIIKEFKGANFKITPVAKYILSGMVVSKKSYWYGWKSKLSPVDLAFAWGKLTDPEYDKFLSYSQGNRWYYWKYKSGSPVDNSYIISHTSNNHIIPASKNIIRAVKTIKKKQKVRLEGYLVKIDGTYKGDIYWWNSSLTRSDTGDASCEVFYVTKAKIRNKIYE